MRAGLYAGQAIDLSATLAVMRRAQYRAADDPARSLAIARVLVAARLTAAREKAAALAAGLDPAVGFLHAERAGRPALALGLINAGALAAEHFGHQGAVFDVLPPAGPGAARAA